MKIKKRIYAPKVDAVKIHRFAGNKNGNELYTPITIIKILTTIKTYVVLKNQSKTF